MGVLTHIYIYIVVTPVTIPSRKLDAAIQKYE